MKNGKTDKKYWRTLAEARSDKLTKMKALVRDLGRDLEHSELRVGELAAEVRVLNARLQRYKLLYGEMLP